MDPVTVIRLAKVYQQELLDSAANDRWGVPASREIMKLISEHIGSNLQQQAARELFAGVRSLGWLCRLLGHLVSAVKAVDTRQPDGSVVCADPCAIEGE